MVSFEGAFPSLLRGLPSLSTPILRAGAHDYAAQNDLGGRASCPSAQRWPWGPTDARYLAVVAFQAARSLTRFHQAAKCVWLRMSSFADVLRAYAV